MNVITFPTPTPAPAVAPRYAVATKRRGRPVQVVSRHSSIREAGEALAALLRQPAPRGLEGLMLYDGEPSDRVIVRIEVRSAKAS